MKFVKSLANAVIVSGKFPFADSLTGEFYSGLFFSFGCGLDSHAPLNCKLLAVWIRKCNDDRETSQWISANTKVPCSPLKERQ